METRNRINNAYFDIQVTYSRYRSNQKYVYKLKLLLYDNTWFDDHHWENIRT